MPALPAEGPAASQRVVRDLLDPSGASITTAERAPTGSVVDASRSTDFGLLVSAAAPAVEQASGTPGLGYQNPDRYLLTDGSITVFRDIPARQLERAEVQALLRARQAFKQNLFADAVAELADHPELADLRPCVSLQDAETGLCILDEQLQARLLAQSATAPAAGPQLQAAIPQIQHKRALVIGLNHYRDSHIPQLNSALPDARAIAVEMKARLGYETTLLENPDKAQIARALNRLSLQMSSADSLVIYFAGHGELVEKTGLGYWIPSDATARDPRSWISNTDVARWLQLFRSRQIGVIIDSCYSGTFADHRDGPAGESSDHAHPEQFLDKRTVAVMTSGSDEPVADTGTQGHSVFAWSLIQQLRGLEQWEAGSNVFANVRDDVERELPQSPQYGAALKAGHEAGGEFLFERRTAAR